MNEKLLAGIAASLLLAPIFVQIHYAIADGSDTATGSVTIPATCGLATNSTITFGSVARGAIADERTLGVNNTGTVSAAATISGKNWKTSDNADTYNIDGFRTKFATSDLGSGTAYSAKTALNSTTGAISFGSIKPGEPGTTYPNATYWQVQSVLVNLPFTGSLSQLITIAVTC